MLISCVLCVINGQREGRCLAQPITDSNPRGCMMKEESTLNEETWRSVLRFEQGGFLSGEDARYSLGLYF